MKLNQKAVKEINEEYDRYTQNMILSKQILHVFTGHKARSWEILILDNVSVDALIRDRVASIIINIDLCH